MINNYQRDAGTEDDRDSGSISLIAPLKAGDQVWVEWRGYGDSFLYSNPYRLISFTGFLVRPSTQNLSKLISWHSWWFYLNFIHKLFNKKKERLGDFHGKPCDRHITRWRCTKRTHVHFRNFGFTLYCSRSRIDFQSWCVQNTKYCETYFFKSFKNK